ncbi:hypothetical protein AWZ03_012491 [Drosophila navojoa]|uniref:Uncharacterized protein n=1 Tax=Drosophila navojoa TaxID=7232 RepID=A0A484AXE6_DRONA|nr:hypothetical protein AWZ03_012491 [Drosophila navojoa]
MDKSRRTSQQSGRNQGKALQTGRNSLDSSTSDTGVNVPPFNHPHCDRQAMYQQPVRKVKPLRGSSQDPLRSNVRDYECFQIFHKQHILLVHAESAGLRHYAYHYHRFH